jgi:hypothetical protein
MFDVMAINPLTIDSFDVNLDTGITDDIEVYFKTGTWVGYHTDPSAWTLVATANVTSAGDGLPTPLGLSLGINVAAGERVAFYVTTINGGMNYTNGSTTGNLFASDANLEFYEGRGMSYPFTGGFEPRVFNGNIHYTTGATGGGLEFTCADLGENLIEVTVTDDSGNVSTCMATVNVIDNISPVLTCGPTNTFTDMEDFEGSSIPAGWSTDIASGSHDWTFGSGVMPGGDDFPTNAAIFDDDAAGSGSTNVASLLSPVYDTDGANMATISFDYSLQDFAGDGKLTVEVYDGSAWQQVLLVDNQDVPPTNSGPIDVLAYANADFQVRFTYDDEGSWAWGAGVDNFEITYDVPPVNNYVEVEIGPDGTGTVDPNALLSNIEEACGIATLAVDVTEVTCADIGTPILVTVFASDTSGNIASCTVEVMAVDNLAPELTCPADQTVDPGPGNLFYVLPDYFATGEATADDNCTDPVTVTTQDPAAGTPLPDGTYTITLTAEDDYGNVATCSFELTVESTVGIAENSLDAGVTLYPNPAGQVVNLVNGTGIALERMAIYDVNGMLVGQTDLRGMQQEKSVDISQLASGVYMVQIFGDNASTVKRLIKE